MATTKQAEFPNPRTLALEADTTLRLPRGRPVAVRVERGTVLVTQEGDPEDHVLERGHELVLDGGGLAVAWALGPAAIAVREAARPRRDRRRLPHLEVRWRSPAHALRGVM